MAAAARAIRKFQVTIDTAGICNLARRSTRTFGPIVLELLPAEPYSGRDPRNVHSLGITLGRQRGVHAIGCDTRVDFDAWPGVLAYTPPGIDVFSESPAGGEYLLAPGRARWRVPMLCRSRGDSNFRVIGLRWR